MLEENANALIAHHHRVSKGSDKSVLIGGVIGGVVGGE